ncbi:MAG: 50S ribosomal protein L11 methyltransferase, partial [Desulfobulbales bacterium]
MNSSTKWLKITFTSPENITEAISDLIGVLSGVGVEIRPHPDQTTNSITGFFALEDATSEEKRESAATRCLQQITPELNKFFALYNLPRPSLTTEIIDDQDWATSWQHFFSAFEIIPGLVIKPSWEEYKNAEGKHVVTMDPGMAFGTGQHASTRLALSFIASCFNNPDGSRPKKVLDVGTGTGILAMAAAMFGADQVMAIDNDPEAVKIALHNVRLNHLDWNIGVTDRPLSELHGSFDLICANIVHD